MHRVAVQCSAVLHSAWTHRGLDTDTDVDACLGEILPAPSCVLFTMLVDVVDMLVDIVDMFGFVLRHECIVDQ